MKAVTIDRLQIKDHVRWAEDQKKFDASFVKESLLAALLPEVMGVSAIYPSKFEALFELQKRNVGWASFESPQNFHLFGRRFFSHRLFAHIDWEEEERDREGSEQEGGEEKESENEKLKKMAGMLSSLKRMPHQARSLFEKDKTTLLNLLEMISLINSLLVQINGKKLQYQKG